MPGGRSMEASLKFYIGFMQILWGPFACSVDGLCELHGSSVGILWKHFGRIMGMYGSRLGTLWGSIRMCVVSTVAPREHMRAQAALHGWEALLGAFWKFHDGIVEALWKIHKLCNGSHAKPNRKSMRIVLGFLYESCTGFMGLL